jgi:glycosyltransferase involved in cell wall biosynthesis
MRVLAVTNLYPNPLQPHRAPFNRHQLRLLGARHPLRVIAPVAWTDELALARAGTGRVARAVVLDGLPVEHPRYYFPPKVGRGWYGHCFAASVRGAFRRAVHEFAPDVVFAPWAYPDGWAAVRLARRAGLPVVVQVHGSDVKLLDQFPTRRRRTAEALTGADGVIAVSGDLRDRVVGLGVPADRVAVIYDGVDPQIFHPGDRAAARAAVNLHGGWPAAPVLLFVGNLVAVKGIDVLLHALASSKSPGRLVVVGAGPERAPLARLAGELGVADRVTFLGSLPQAALPDWYRAADLFVLPSRSEGVPNVLLEASACGTPWVASRVGGIPEMPGHASRRLVPPENPEALTAAIADALAAGRPDPADLPPPKSRTAAVDELEATLSHFALKGPHRD